MNTRLSIVTSLFVFANCQGPNRIESSLSSSPSESTEATTELVTPSLSVDYDALYVVNGGDGTVSVIDTITNKVAATIKLRKAKFPHHIYMSADRSTLLVAVPGMDMSGGHKGGMAGMHGKIFKLDARSGKTLKQVTLPAMNHNAIYSPDGTEVWTSQMAVPGSVLVLDAQTLATKSSIAVGDQPAEVTFSSDGKRAFVAAGGSNEVTVIDVATKTVVQDVGTAADPVGAWQGKNGVAYVDSEEGKTLAAIDTSSLSVLRTWDLGFTPGYAALAPDEQTVWVTNADAGSVVLKAIDADTTVAEIACGAGAHAIVFSGDGTTAYVTNQFSASVSVIDVTSRQVTTTIAVGTKPNGILWRAK